MAKTRTATLRVAHQNDCVNKSRTSLDSLTDEGSRCTCKPSYYTFHRDRQGNAVKGPRVRDRQVADRALRKLLVEIDEDRVDVGPRRRTAKTFDEWAADYLVNIQRDGGAKPSTVRAYESTLSYASPIMGHLNLDEVGVPELRLMVRAIRKNEVADATVSKHLKHLSAIFNGAVDEEIATRNPVGKKFVKGLSLQIPRGLVEPYTDVELAKLWAKMNELTRRDPVYLYISKAAVVTGARLGELIALDCDDLDLHAKTLKITKTWNPIDGLTTPKDRDARTLDLIPDAVTLLEKWIALVGVQPGGSPIFPAPRGKDRLNGQFVARRVDDARVKAGISDVGEDGRKRKPFHAFRASFNRICREQGLNEDWRQAQMGHATISQNLEYGAPSRAARRAEADRATSFPV